MTPLLLLLSAALFGQSARLTLDHASNIVRLASVEVSPNGKCVAMVVSRPNYEDNRFDTELVLVDPASGEQRRLTFDRRGVASPKWSPSGDRIAFLADSAGKVQLFVMPMSGGDAQQLTHAANPVQRFAWRPDGAALAYVVADEAEKKTGAERHNGSFEVGNDSILTQAPPVAKHMWLVSANGGPARRLTSGSWSAGAGDLSWSPDGKLIAFVRSSTAHTGDARDNVIHVLDVSSGASRPLTGRSSMEASPRFSPDGRFVAYDYPARGRYHPTETMLSPVGGGEGRTLTRALDRNTQLIEWTRDGSAVLVAGNDQTKTGVWLQPLEGAARRVDLAGGSFTREPAISTGSHGEIAYVAATPSNPGELFWKASPDAAPKQLTHFNDAVSQLALGKTERLVWKSDAYTLDGVVTYPPDFKPSGKYPLLLDIHGGPTSASKQGFSPRAQLLAAQGWVVFEPNYRGSDNLGDAVQSGIINDAGEGPGRDVMRGIEELRKRGWVDEKRIGTGGWSYGGYMTAWLLGHYPDVWKAAVAGAAAVDRMDSYNFSDINVGFGPMLGGSPWADGLLQKYRAQSAIEYVNRIKTPTMILHNTKDERVLITNGYKLYHALRDRNVPVKFIAYPVAGHSAPDPVHQRDVLRRWVEWFNGHFNSVPALSGGAQ